MLPLKDIQTPAYVMDEAALLRNLELLKSVKEAAGCSIVLALKSFAVYPLFPLMSQYLDGTTASGIYEARLGREEFGEEVHVYSPGFDDAEMEALLPIASHISFNSANQ
ncbi:MAG: carboxynorspermidine decarboxylase, partial [Alphaproteobacteria bacterium]|nr:carboxynorspermidine decarboxylase [Alphaproteobacteria bacterium]